MRARVYLKSAFLWDDVFEFWEEDKRNDHVARLRQGLHPKWRSFARQAHLNEKIHSGSLKEIPMRITVPCRADKSARYFAPWIIHCTLPYRRLTLACNGKPRKVKKDISCAGDGWSFFRSFLAPALHIRTASVYLVLHEISITICSGASNDVLMKKSWFRPVDAWAWGAADARTPLLKLIKKEFPSRPPAPLQRYG